MNRVCMACMCCVMSYVDRREYEYLTVNIQIYEPP